MDLLSLKKLACETIDKREEDLKKLSSEIWNHPELGLEEYLAHELLTTFLRNEGLEVRQKYPLETSFVAKYGEDQKDSLKIGICCEYDALPGIGHACGHNLIAEAAIAVALGNYFIGIDVFYVVFLLSCCPQKYSPEYVCVGDSSYSAVIGNHAF